jgi:predicted nucleic acid-binding protein
MSVFIDSDILIEVLRARNASIRSSWEQLAFAGTPILYSPITAAEIWAGARAYESELTARIFRPLRCVPVDHAAGELAGEFLRRYAKSHSLELPDALIAASAHQHHARLWTRNRKHYPMPEITFHE